MKVKVGSSSASRCSDCPTFTSSPRFFDETARESIGEGIVSFGALNLGVDGRYVLVALSLSITAGLAVWLWRAPVRRVALALGAVIGGALGNVIDRLVYGAVADFFDLHVAGWHWPAFNIADAAIVLGVATLLLDSLLPAATDRK